MAKLSKKRNAAVISVFLLFLDSNRVLLNGIDIFLPNIIFILMQKVNSFDFFQGRGLLSFFLAPVSGERIKVRGIYVKSFFELVEII